MIQISRRYLPKPREPRLLPTRVPWLFRKGEQWIIRKMMPNNSAFAAADFIITNAVAQSILSAFATACDAGTAAVINIYDGSIPADADASIGASTLLAQLTMSSTAWGSPADANPNATITAAAITDDSSANATGTATYFRILTQNAGTVICQGTVATSSADMIVNTTAFTSGSTVSCSSAVVTMPEQA